MDMDALTRIGLRLSCRCPACRQAGFLHHRL